MASLITVLPTNSKPIITNYTDSKRAVYQTKIPASGANNPQTLASNFYSVKLPQRMAEIISAKLTYGWKVPCFAGGYQSVGATQNNVPFYFYPKFFVFDTQTNTFAEFQPVIDDDNTPWSQTVTYNIANNNYNLRGFYELDFAQYAGYDAINNVRVNRITDLFKDDLVEFGAFIYHDNTNTTVGNLYIEVTSNFAVSYSYMG